jgi:hypothetical protein
LHVLSTPLQHRPRLVTKTTQVVANKAPALSDNESGEHADEVATASAAHSPLSFFAALFCALQKCRTRLYKKIIVSLSLVN